MKLWQWMALGAMFFGIGSGCASGITQTSLENTMSAVNEMSSYQNSKKSYYPSDLRHRIFNFFQNRFRAYNQNIYNISKKEDETKNTILLLSEPRYNIFKETKPDSTKSVSFIERNDNGKNNFRVELNKDQKLIIFIYDLFNFSSLPDSTADSLRRVFQPLTKSYYLATHGDANSARDELLQLNSALKEGGTEEFEDLFLSYCGILSNLDGDNSAAQKFYAGAEKKAKELFKEGKIDSIDYCKFLMSLELNRARLNPANHKKALEHTIKAKKFMDALSKTNPNRTETIKDAALIDYNFAEAYFNLGDNAQALEYYKSTISKLEEFLKYRSSFEIKIALIQIYEKVAKKYYDQDDIENSFRLLDKLEELKKGPVILVPKEMELHFFYESTPKELRLEF